MRKPFAAAAITALFSTFALGQSPNAAPAKPPPPPASIPKMTSANTVIVCADCAPFDTATHKVTLEGLASSPYIGELRKALYTQDTYHQFESKAHFDNCDFEGANAYITQLLVEVGKHVDRAAAAKAAKDDDGAQKAILDAFFALGQALHGTQDFYAHTNYVELQVAKAVKVTDIPIIQPWEESGRIKIAELRTTGLVSGFVFWGLPQKCPTGALSHADLAKDSADTKSGRVVVPHLQNLNQYRIAVYLAREASLKLVEYAFKKWPLLKEFNGENVAFGVLTDRRGL